MFPTRKERLALPTAQLKDPIVFKVDIFNIWRVVDDLLPLFRHARHLRASPNMPAFAIQTVCSHRYPATVVASDATQTFKSIALELDAAAKSVKTLYDQMTALGESSPRTYTAEEWKKMRADMLDKAAELESSKSTPLPVVDEKVNKACNCRCGANHPSNADVEAHNKRLEGRIAALEEEVQALRSSRDNTPTSTVYSI